MKILKTAVFLISTILCLNSFCEDKATTKNIEPPKETKNSKIYFDVNEIEVTGDKLEASLTNGRVITLSGNTKMFDKDDIILLTADKMIVTLNDKNKPIKAEIIGNIYVRYVVTEIKNDINTDEKTGEKKEVKIEVKVPIVMRGGHAVYNIEKDIAIITEKPEFERLSMKTYGMEKIIYDRKTDKLTTEGVRPEIGQIKFEKIKMEEFENFNKNNNKKDSKKTEK